MADITFLPWARAGAAATINATGAVMGANRPTVQVELTVSKTPDQGPATVIPAGQPAGHPSVTVAMPMLGPGDVLGLAPGQVIRTEPADGAAGVLTTTFPAVDFGDPTLPWLFTPAAENVGWPGGQAPPAGSHRLLPWICLVVVPDADGIALDTSAGTLTIGPPADARRELPDLADAWAWAHVQYAGDLDADATGTAPPPSGTVHAAVTAAATQLAANPASVLSRLLSPRQLATDTRYFACVVPTFMAGRVAGLGGSPDPAAAAGPAWDVSAAGEASLTLPVYLSFSFTTGTGGDFLSLAQLLLHPPDVSAAPGSGLGPATLTVNVPAPAGPASPATSVALDRPGMLQPADATPVTDPASFAAVQQWLQAAITPSPADPLPELRPTLYGAAQAGISPADLITNFAGQPAWFTTLNSDPRLRAAAALGKRVVAAQREQLVAAAWTQAEQARQANALLSRAQLARTITERQAARHLPGDSVSLPGDSVSFLQLTSPHATRVQVTAGNLVGSIWSVVRASPADPRLAAVTSPAYRRLARPRGPHARQTATATPPPVLIPPDQLTPDASAFSPALTVAGRILSERLSPPAASAAQADGQKDPLRGFARQVSFTAGMFTPLAQLDQEAILPGGSAIPANTALTLEPNPLPIAAYMVGLNTEISRLLLWRGVPADPRGTPFAYFWDQRGQAAGGQPDIQPIAAWPPAATLAAQVSGDVGGIVLAVRADLLRRYPNTAVYATPAQAAGSGTHTYDISNPANVVQPAFTATLPPDLRLFGFPGISAQDALGGPAPGGGTQPGYFFIFQEQASETRFGTDAMTKAGLPAPAGQYWTSASLAPLAGGQPPGDAGGVAGAVRMPPVLVAMHARALLPTGG
jgi:hypothetical protein